jgi:hypothetical protein
MGGQVLRLVTAGSGIGAVAGWMAAVALIWRTTQVAAAGWLHRA